MTTTTGREEGILAYDHYAMKTYVVAELAPHVTVPPKTRTKWAKQVDNLFHPVPNGFNDPISTLNVLDAVMRLRPTDKIRAKFLVTLLQQTRGHIIWDAVTVGRILGEITMLAYDAFPEKERPISSKRDYIGTFWQIRHTATAHAWLSSLRNHIGAVADETFKREMAGEAVKRGDSVWADWVAA